MWPPKTTSAAALMAAADCTSDTAWTQPGFFGGTNLPPFLLAWAYRRTTKHGRLPTARF
jgi:hypothetical protein